LPVEEPVTLTGPTGYAPRTPPAPSVEARTIDLERRVRGLDQQVRTLRDDLAELVTVLLSRYAA
jgi:hypothetical protein